MGYSHPPPPKKKRLPWWNLLGKSLRESFGAKSVFVEILVIFAETHHALADYPRWTQLIKVDSNEPQ